MSREGRETFNADSQGGAWSAEARSTGKGWEIISKIKDAAKNTKRGDKL